jgi:hypothetical protein
MSWSVNLGGHASGATAEDQKAVEAGVVEVLGDAFKKLKALHGHEFTPPKVYFQHHGAVDFNEALTEKNEGSDD